MNRFATCGAAMVLLLSACSGGDTDTDGADAGLDATDAGAVADAAPELDAAPEVTPLEAFCAADGPYAALLESVAECGGFFMQLEISGTILFRGEALTRFCTEQFGSFLDSGTVDLDVDSFAACKNYAETVGCEALQEGGFGGTPCAALFLGTVALGGECDETFQCVGDAYCDAELSSCGVCTARLADGEACTFSDVCTGGLCNSSGVCASPGVIGDACTDPSDCAGILTCRDDVCASTLPQVDTPCANQAECSGLGGDGIPFELGLYCAPGPNKGDPASC